jgi:high-affinity iron transporter
VLGPLVITLREGLEAALVVGILLACLTRIGEGRRKPSVWLGVGLAVVASLLAGGTIFLTVGELEESAAQIFEGLTLIVAVSILSYMVLWMHRQAGDLRANLQRQIAEASASRSNLPLTLLAFVVVVREGIETGLFLFGATRESQPIPALVGGLLGLAIAAVLGYGIYRGGLRLNLGAFFRVTGVLLVFFAAGMLAYGLHELGEASIFPAIVDPIYDLNAVLPDNESLGGFLKALLGYNGDPALSESVLYVVYLAGMLRFSISRPERRVVRRQEEIAPAA